MKLAHILLKLWKLRIWVAVGVCLAAVAAVASLTMFRSAVFASASTQMLVDSPQSALADARTDLTGYTARAVVFARLMTTAGALSYIGQAAGIPGNLIAAAGPVELAGPNATHSPTALRGGRLVSAPATYKLDFLQNPEVPTVDVYAVAPTTKQAIALANGAVTGFAAYIGDLEAHGAIQGNQRIVVRPLGAATGGVVDPGVSKTTAAMIFVAVLALWCGLVLFVQNLRGQLRTAKVPDSINGRGTAHQPNGAEFAAHVPRHQTTLPHRTAMREADAHSGADLDQFLSEGHDLSNHTGDRDEEDDVRRGLRLRP